MTTKKSRRMIWGSIDIAIPTVLPERKDSLSYLLTQIAEQCPGGHIRVVPHVHGRPSRNRVQTVFGQCRSETALLQFEDDVILSSSFGKSVGKILTSLASNIQNGDLVPFCSLRKRSPGVHRCSPSQFFGLYCVAMSSKTATNFAAYYLEWIVRQSHKHHDAVDVALGNFVGSMKRQIYVCFPSLVQHRKLKSLIGSRSKFRQSPTFQEGKSYDN